MRVVVSVQENNSGVVTEQDTGLIQFLGKGVELFMVELSRVETGGISCTEVGFFTL